MEKAKRKILIAEDDKFLANAYRLKFEKTDFEVIIAADGEETLELAKKEMPDILLLDLIMPKKDGFVVLEELKKSERLRKIPVVITSNLSQQEDVKRGMDLGAKDYFIKSDVTLEQIVEKINKLIK